MSTAVPQAITIHRIFDSAENVKTFVFKSPFPSDPGQFVMLWLPGIDEKPFSIAHNDDELWLTICNVGRFTAALFEKQAGDTIGIRGPFGHGYTLVEKKSVVLVGGGYGMAPLHYCGLKQQENGCSVSAITGARSAKNVLFESACKESGFETFVTTDDGSAGRQGFVTEQFEEILVARDVDLVQTCGPEKMMYRIAEMCQERDIPCEVSVERYMKCGFGVCGQCVVDGAGERMCREGPVVNGERALREFSDFGASHRGAEGQKVAW